MTRNRFVGVGMGAFVTAIIQSSSVTTVLMVGFISAGLMSMSQSVAVIIGANIGTTITAQILAFKVTKTALPLEAGGFLLSFTAKRENRRQTGMIILGLGLVFYGMGIINFLGQISLSKLSERQSKELMLLAQVANDLEQIGDRIATAMVTSAGKRIEEEVQVSPQTAKILSDYHAEVVTTLDEALKSVTTQDPKRAKQMRRRKKELTQMSRDIAAHGLDRLTADEPNRLNTYAREMEVMEILKGVLTIARRIAQTQT